MNARLILGIIGWLLVTALATGAGVAVIGLVGGPLAAPTWQPMTAEEIRLALARATPAPTRTSTSSPAVRREGAGARLIPTAGGNVIARCDGGQVRLLSWTPAQRFEADDVDPGPDDRARITFESDEPETEVEIEVRCAGDVPTPRVRTRG